MKITITNTRPSEKLAIDTVRPLPITENDNKYIITNEVT